MPTDGDSLASQVKASFSQLSSVAFDLNIISDELGKSIAEIDDALKKLNLGISVWVEIGKWSRDDLAYSFENVGYAKVGGKWGIALESGTGLELDPDGETSEVWLFSDAPRKLRLSSIEKVPELLKRLGEEAVTSTKEIKGKLAEVKEIAAAVKGGGEASRAKMFPPTLIGRKMKVSE